MVTSFAKSFLGMVLAHDGDIAPISAGAWLEDALKAARAAFDSGNDLGALDAR